MYGGISQGEKLINTGSENREHNTEKPHAHSINRQVWIVGFGYDSSNYIALLAKRS